MAPPQRSPAELVASAALAALGDESSQPPPSPVLATLTRWVEELECRQGLPSAVEAIPLAILAGPQHGEHGWFPAVIRWWAFKAEAEREVRQALGPGVSLDATDFDAWLERRVRRPWPDGTPPRLNWLEKLYSECFTRYLLPGPGCLPDWWPQIVGPPPGPGGGQLTLDRFVEEECQGHPVLHDALAALNNDHFAIRNGASLTYLEFLRQRYRNDGAEDPTPTAQEMAERLGVAPNSIDVYLGRVRSRLLELLEPARLAGTLRVSGAWVKRALPQPIRYVVAWPWDACDCGVIHVGLFAWTLPGKDQLNALTEQECQGHDALRGILQALAALRASLAQEGKLMSYLEFVHACYCNRLGAELGPPTADVLARELTAAGFVHQGPPGPGVTAATIREGLKQVREVVEDRIEAARGGGRLQVPEWWAGLALPGPAMYAPGQLFYPLPNP
jgi:hypothetical protein